MVREAAGRGSTVLLDRKWMQTEIVTKSTRWLSIIYKLFNKNYFGSNEQKESISRYIEFYKSSSFTWLSGNDDLFFK